MGELHNLSLRGEDIDLLCLECKEGRLQSLALLLFARSIVTYGLQCFAYGGEEVIQTAFTADALVAPVGSDTLLGDGIHALGAYLYLYPAVLRSEYGRMQTLIPITLGDGDPVLESLGVGAIHVGDDRVDLPAYLTLALGWDVHDDTDSEDIIDILEGELLQLVADRADALHASLHLKGYILEVS